MKQNGYRTLRLGMKRYVNKFDNLNDAITHNVHHDAVYNTVHHDAEYTTVCK